MASRKRGRPFGSQLSLSARKERKIMMDRERGKERIFIGDHVERWTRLKEDLNLMYNHEVAGFLLDRAMSGIEQMEAGPSGGEDPKPPNRKKAKGSKYSASFVDPLEISIDISEEVEDLEESDDELYQPSINISIGPKDITGTEDCPGVESVFPTMEEEEEEEEEEAGPSICRVLTEEDFDHLIENKTALVYLMQLKALANKKVDSLCKVKGCGEGIEMSIKHVGSAIYLKWICRNSHVMDRWCSQPVLNKGLHGGYLMIASSILFSGNNFSKMELFAKFLQMGFPSQSSFTRLQRRYLVPSVDHLWSQKQEELIAELANKQLILLGDGRMDSSGHCAQFCTYTLMENGSKKILSVNTLDKRETERKSGNMEKAGFIRGIQEVQDSGLEIAEVVTDAHIQIGALMRKDYPAVKHSHDVWHAAKNLGKKLISAGQEKSCKELQKWSKDIVNHFWFTCKTANNLDEFMGMWVGVLHHVVGEHEWYLPYSENGISMCKHDPLTGEETGDKEFLIKGSPAHEALRKIILDKRLLHNIPYYLNFRSTAVLESFHNHMLMYSSKRFAYTPPVYRARSLLAALDYNENVEREPLVNKDGTVRMQRTFNKKSGRWTVYAVKEKKKYTHVLSLFRIVLQRRIEDREGLQGRMVLEVGDPRRISKTIAPVLPPRTRDLAEEKKSRFKD